MRQTAEKCLLSRYVDENSNAPPMCPTLRHATPINSTIADFEGVRDQPCRLNVERPGVSGGVTSALHLVTVTQCSETRCSRASALMNARAVTTSTADGRNGRHDGHSGPTVDDAGASPLDARRRRWAEQPGGF